MISMQARLCILPLALTAALSGCRDHYVISERVLLEARAAAATIPDTKIAVAVERDLEKDRHEPPTHTHLRLSGLETGGLLRDHQTRRRVSIVNRERGRNGGGTLLGFGVTMVGGGLLSIIVSVALNKQHKLDDLGAGVIGGLGGGLLIGVGAHLLIPGAVLVAQTSGPPREVPPAEPGVTYLP